MVPDILVKRTAEASGRVVVSLLDPLALSNRKHAGRVCFVNLYRSQVMFKEYPIAVEEDLDEQLSDLRWDGLAHVLGVFT